jgi:hypothetical protein
MTKRAKRAKRKSRKRLSLRPSSTLLKRKRRRCSEKVERRKGSDRVRTAEERESGIKGRPETTRCSEEVVNALTAAGANSPALAFDAIRGGLKFDEEGKLLNSKDLIEGLKTSYPEQFGTPKTTETIDAGKGQQGGGDKLTKDKLAKMTPTEINALDWKEVSAVMAGE